MDKTLQSRQISGTNVFFFYFFLPNMSGFASQTFFISLKLLLKELGVRVDFFNTGNLHKNLWSLILKFHHRYFTKFVKMTSVQDHIKVYKIA